MWLSGKAERPLSDLLSKHSCISSCIPEAHLFYNSFPDGWEQQLGSIQVQRQPMGVHFIDVQLGTL